jgi:predicted anti-sigma-YlaC factor YlaD
VNRQRVIREEYELAYMRMAGLFTEVPSERELKTQRVNAHPEEYKACRKAYNQTAERKAYRKAYRQTAEYKAYQKAYMKAYRQRKRLTTQPTGEQR